jgi:hypothetical protein
MAQDGRGLLAASETNRQSQISATKQHIEKCVATLDNGEAPTACDNLLIEGVDAIYKVDATKTSAEDFKALLDQTVHILDATLAATPTVHVFPDDSAANFCATQDAAQKVTAWGYTSIDRQHIYLCAIWTTTAVELCRDAVLIHEYVHAVGGGHGSYVGEVTAETASDITCWLSMSGGSGTKTGCLYKCAAGNDYAWH